MKKLLVAVSVIAAVSGTANVLMFERYSTRRPLMRIGSEIISKKDYQDSLEYQYGKPVLNKLAYTKLIRQAAARAGITPTSQEVETRLAEIERRTPKALQAVKRDPAKMDQLKRDLATDLALENLRIRNVKAGSGEVAAFYEHNKPLFALPAQAQTVIVISQNAVDASTAAALLGKNMSSDVIARQPRLNVVGVNGFNPDWRQLPAGVREKISGTVFKMKSGDVTTLPVGTSFLSLRVNKQNGAGVPPLEKIKDRVARLARLQKAPAPDVQLAKLYKDAHVTFETDRYAAYFEDIQKLGQQKAEKTANAH